MIRSIHVNNFQSHANTTIEPGPGGQLTVITGPSDSGKTAVLRALRWLFYNVPQGADFIRAGCTFARVAVTLEDGTEVERLRTPSKNQYVIRRPGAESQVYEGFGSGVPFEVQEALGVRPITIGDLELALNLAEQLDGPFLGRSISAGARAKVLGMLAGTEEIDVAARTLNTDIYRRNQDEKRLTVEVDELGKRIEGYAWVPELGAKIEALEGILAGLKATEERKAKLSALATRVLDNASQTRLTLAALDRLSFLPTLEQHLLDIAALVARTGVLQSTRARLEVVTANTRDTQAKLVRLAGTDDAIATLTTAASSLEASRSILDLRRRLHENDVATAVTERTVVKLAGADEAAAITGDLGIKAMRLSRVGDAGRRFHAVEAAMVTPRETTKKLAGVDEAHQVTLDAAAKAEKLGRLARMAAVVADLRTRFDEARAVKERTFHAEEAAKFIAEASEAQERRNKLVTATMKLIALNSAMGDARMGIERWARAADSATQAYIDELVAVGRCPVCGSDIDPIKLKEAV